MENTAAIALSGPVRLLRDDSPAAPSGHPAAASQLDVEWERRLVADAGNTTSEPNAASIREVLQSLAVVPPETTASLQQGSSLEDLRLAVALVGPQRAPAFAGHLAQLRGMGFSAASVCGALLESDGDADRAANRLAS